MNRSFWNGFLVGAALGIASFARADGQAFGSIYKSIGHSMDPAIHDGQSVVIDLYFPFNSLKVGDIVVYNRTWSAPAGAPAWVEHRIVRRNIFGLWITKGDNNDREDPYGVSVRNYVGKVLKVLK